MQKFKMISLIVTTFVNEMDSHIHLNEDVIDE